MTCSGVDIESGNPVEITFDDVVLSVAKNETLPRDIYVAPGFIDIQVNGFAGVDYNHPATPHDEIARSLAALFATGVTRFYPTVITGPPGDMVEALANLARAADILPDGDAIDGFHVE